MMHLKNSAKKYIFFIGALVLAFTSSLVNSAGIPIASKHYYIEQNALLSYEHAERIASFNKVFNTIITENTPFIPVKLTNNEYIVIKSKNPNTTWSSQKHGFPLPLLYADTFILQTKDFKYQLTKKDVTQAVILKKAERDFKLDPLGRYKNEECAINQILSIFLEKEILKEEIWCCHRCYTHGALGWFEQKEKIKKAIHEQETHKKSYATILCIQRLENYCKLHQPDPLTLKTYQRS